MWCCGHADQTPAEQLFPGHSVDGLRTQAEGRVGNRAVGPTEISVGLKPRRRRRASEEEDAGGRGGRGGRGRRRTRRTRRRMTQAFQPPRLRPKGGSKTVVFLAPAWCPSAWSSCTCCRPTGGAEPRRRPGRSCTYRPGTWRQRNPSSAGSVPGQPPPWCTAGAQRCAAGGANGGRGRRSG